MQFKTIYADPPWPELGGGVIKRGADRHYPLMSLKEIQAIPISLIAEPNSHLYMWITNNYLMDGRAIMQTWGFRYITCITWTKDRFGLGQYFRGQTEHCLFGVRGMVPYKEIDGKRAQSTTSLIAPRGEHSVKPDDMRQRIQRVSTGPYIELFARTNPEVESQYPEWMFLNENISSGDINYDIEAIAALEI